MNLFWLLLPADHCSFDELQKRERIAIGWAEVGTIEKYIRDKPNWERQFKGYVQLRGDLAYGRNSTWMQQDRQFDQVPEIFWKLLQIKSGDVIVAVESGKEITFGRPVIRGIGRVTQDALTTYDFDEKYHHAHSVCPDTKWLPWDSFTMGELKMPKENFRTLCNDNSQMENVAAGWKIAVENFKKNN